ncbi:protein toll-like [Schistocerca piceifrons]|uniref:protein toll-like n=1 Tax=Schistocerca piceifrons TaxID=274613 RepID=UPI001F5EA53A|nr:protein toll-like [Schistocerca piceifrons]
MMSSVLPRLLSAFMLLLSVSGSSACHKACHCQSYNEKFEIICAHNLSSWNDWQIKEIVFRDSLELTCKSGISPEDVYAWIDRRKNDSGLPPLEHIKVVTLSDCPLPPNGIPLKDIIGLGHEVKKLYFKSCDGKSFQRSHFSGLNASLTHLTLYKCDIQSLPADVFQELGLLLEELDMRENFLETVPSNSLAPLGGLKYLELSNNRIHTITDGSFVNLPSLKLLNLWGNKDLQLFHGSLLGLRNLTSLDLGVCNINSLPDGLFSDLKNLQNISLVANNFTTLPERLFLPTDLRVLKLFHNRQQLRIPDNLLANLKNLKEVHMHSNGISELPENLIWDSPNVSVLKLQQNKLTRLPPSLLKGKHDLTQLDLSENTLESIPNGFFDTANKLKTINLSRNRIQTLQRGVLHGLQHLLELDLSRNELREIKPQSFPDAARLASLDLSHNKLRDLSASKVNIGFGKSSVFNTLIHLEELNLSNNFVSEIYSDWMLSMLNLKKLNLSYNNVTQISVNEMQFLSNGVTVDLRSNNLTVVNLESADAIAIAQSNNKLVKPHFILADNTVDCCASFHLLKYVHGNVHPAVYNMFDIDADEATCLTTKRLMSQTKLEDILCEGPCCLPPWECKIRLWDRAWLLRCEKCWIDGRKPPVPSNFSCKPGGTKHSEVYLHNNEFTSIPKGVLQPNLNITALHLSHNWLSEINIHDITPFLQELELNHNYLQHLDDEVVALIKTKKPPLQKIVLSENPWECDCRTKQLLQFLQDDYVKVIDRRNISCSDGRPLPELTNDDLCPLPKFAIIVSSVCLAMTGIAVGLLAFLYHRYQEDVKVWLYARNLCLWFVTEEELDRDKMYDAFVSYSHKDEEFVVEQLVRGLENGPVPFKLCLHYRDWIAGEWITEQIARSIERSCRTLVVLSPNFLESVWGKMEFRAAHKKALAEGRARVIIVMYGEIGDMEKLDPELKAYLSTNTYVKWGDPWFWDKLRYALPHSQKLHGATRSRTVSDRMELIGPGTPSPLVTPIAEVHNPLEQQQQCNVNCYNNKAFT